MADESESPFSFLARRRSPRIEGPFDARRLGLISSPLRVTDLSVGGCLIESLVEEKAGRKLDLEIDLPHVGTLQVSAIILYIRPEHGFAVRFVDVDDVTRTRLESVVQRSLDDDDRRRRRT